MTHRRRTLAVVLVALSLVASACGSRLSGSALALAEGSGHDGPSSGSSAGSTSGSNGTSGSAADSSTSAAGASTGGASTTGGTTPASSGGKSAPSTSGSCTSSNNGGATATGVTADQISLGNITSITGVAPGLTESARDAMEAFAAYVNSTGGICGRTLKVDAYDDGNTSSENYSDAEQACSSDFAMVGNASGFDDGSASAVSSCGIPDVAAEVSTVAAGQTADIYGASPGNSQYWSTGPAVWLKSQYPNAITHAAMIYLNVPATESQATNEMNTYETVGFKYIYTASVSPTEPNYAPYVEDMEQDGVQYVTEYSDLNSAARLSEAMQQADFTPQVVDWFSEMYSPDFLSETDGTADGNLVLMATAPYEEASSNPELELMESWMNRVTPGWTHDIFAELAWSAGLAFLQAAEAVGPDLTRPALLAQLAKIGTWTGDGLEPPMNFGQKIPSDCFSYFKINSSGNGFTRVYPSSAGSYDCTSGTLNHY